MPIFQTGGVPPGYGSSGPAMTGQLPGFQAMYDQMTKVKTKPFAKAFKSLAKVKKAGWEGLGNFAKKAKSGFNMMMGPIGMIVGLAEKMGVMQPILDIIGGILEVIGGAAMGAMGDAIGELVDVLFSDEMMEVWTMLGEAVGGFLSFVMKAIAKLLTNPAIQKLLKQLVLIFTIVVDVIMKLLGPVFDVLGQMSAQQLGLLVYVILVAMAFFKGLMEGTIYLAALYGAVAALVLSPLLTMQEGGITTQPVQAQLHAREVIIPLDRAEEFGIGGGEGVTVNIHGGVFATDERELAKTIAKTIRLYKF